MFITFKSFGPGEFPESQTRALRHIPVDLQPSQYILPVSALIATCLFKICRWKSEIKREDEDRAVKNTLLESWQQLLISRPGYCIKISYY